MGQSFDSHGSNTADPKLNDDGSIQAGSATIGFGTSIASYCATVPELTFDAGGAARNCSIATTAGALNLGSVWVGGAGGGYATADISPTSIAFGSVNTGTTTGTSTVTLTNNGTVTLNYSSIAKGGTDTTKFNLAAGSCVLSGSTLAASASCTYTVSFSPTAATSYSATVVVTSDASPTTTTLTLTGTGVAAGVGGAVSGGGLKLGGGLVYQWVQ